MRRLVAMLIAIAAVAAVAAALMGAETQSPLILAVPVALGALAWARHSLRGGGVELRWTARAAVIHAPAVAIVGDDATLPDTPGPRTPATRRQVAGALARFESRQWLSSPWFGVGVGFCFLLTWTFGWVWAADYDGSWREWFILMPIMAHPMVGMAVVGAHHAVTRGRRDGAEELFSACPADETIRTLAQLRASWVPAAAIVAFVLIDTGLLSIHNPRIYGPIDGRALADVLAGVVLVLCGSALGIALARWTPWRLAPIVFVAALVPVVVELGTLGHPHWSNARQLSTWPQYPDHDLLFTLPPVWWHLLWLGALGALMVWVALVHADRSRRVVFAGVVTMLVVAGAGIAETRPLSAEAADRLAAMVAEPEQHQTCRSSSRVEVCVFEGYEDYLDRVLANVAPVAAAAPGSVDRVTFRQVFDGELGALGPEIAAALDGRSFPVDGFLPLGFLNRDEAMNAARLTMALHAVGLPTRTRFSGAPTLVVGEARGVVAVWLAARGLQADDARDLASSHVSSDASSDPPTAFELGMAWPDPCVGGPSPPVAWSAQDLIAARALLELPVDEVHALLVDNWARFTDPATGTDELLGAAGLEPLGPPDRVVATPVICDWS
jgi:hypothetical protein